MKIITLCLIMFFYFVCIVTAQLYKWVDKEGVTHYSNKRPVTTNSVETKSEIKSNPSSKRNREELNQLIQSYKNSSLKTDNIDSQDRYKSPNKPSKERLEYYEKQIKERERVVNQYSDDLNGVKRKPHKDYRSHKKKLKYYEDRYERARLDLEETKQEYEDFKITR